MFVRHMIGALMAIALTCGMLAVAPAGAQTRDASLLPPEQSGLITVAGCFQRGGKNGDRYVLADPSLGPAANVAEDSCKGSVNERALDLKDTDEYGMNDSMLGKWVEISGRLERETSDDPENLRELYVRSFRMVPVLPPQVEAASPPPPEIEPPLAQAVEPTVRSEAIPAAEEIPVGTTGTEPTLPQTASPLAAAGLVGLLSLAGALAIRLRRG